MTTTYAYHRVTASSRQWRGVADGFAAGPALGEAGAVLYGIWRSQIGRPRDELSVITAWPDRVTAELAEAALTASVGAISGISTEIMRPTLRPIAPDRPIRQGSYAFRWFSTPGGGTGKNFSISAPLPGRVLRAPMILKSSVFGE